MAPMTAYERERARTWLKECRGAISQAALADDISRVMKWRITRDRYSKYESGGADFGAGVLRKFVDYWALQDKPGPDFAAPVIEPPPDLATALLALAEELAAARKERAEYATEVADLKKVVQRLIERGGGASPALDAHPHSTGSGR